MHGATCVQHECLFGRLYHHVSNSSAYTIARTLELAEDTLASLVIGRVVADAVHQRGSLLTVTGLAAATEEAGTT